MRIVFSTRYTYPVHAKRVARLRGWVAKGRRVRSAQTFLSLAFD
jgi:hypothetical protein